MIQIHVDMSVDPAKEWQMQQDFETHFKPAAALFAGYMDVKIVKLRKAFVGRAPEGVNYRFVLRYESEELRQKWITSTAHQHVWPLVERTMTTQKDYPVVLYDEV